MLDYAEKILGERGFRKTLTSKSTPRARFEALSIGIALALEENPELPVRDISSWIDGEEFAICTCLLYTSNAMCGNRFILWHRWIDEGIVISRH